MALNLMTQSTSVLSAVMQSVAFLKCYTECHFTECHCVKCHYAEGCHDIQHNDTQHKGLICDPQHE